LLPVFKTLCRRQVLRLPRGGCKTRPYVPSPKRGEMGWGSIIQEISNIFGLNLVIGVYLRFGLPARSRLGESRCLGFGASLKGLACFAGRDLLEKFFLFRRGKLLFDLPVLLDKGIPSFDQQPFFPCSPSFHKGQGEAAL